MRADGQRFEVIQERDIDLLLVEELVASSNFREWFIEKAISDTVENTTFIDVWHSVYDSEFGESDIEFGVTEDGSQDILVLIENKIDAELQEDQLQRYQKRGEKAVESKWDEFYTCLFAPESYLESIAETDVVDTTLSYESIRDQLADRKTRRANYRSQMLTDAITQARRGYVPEPDEEATSFRRGYWSIAHNEFPELEMKEPTGVPGGNAWERFNPSTLPSGVRINHKMEQSVVDLTFDGKASEEEEFQSRYGPLLEPDMEIDTATSELFVRIPVPSLAWKGDPTTQTEEIREGLKAASRLLDWYVRSKTDPRIVLSS